MAEKGKSTLDLDASANVAPPSQPQQLVTAGGVGSATGYLAKRKRGRPRKIDDAGNSMVPPVSSVASPPVLRAVSPAGFTNRTRGRGRGRPIGSRNWQVLASVGGLFADSAAGDFRAHVIHVYPGEDVIGKIMSLTQGGTRGVCVLSANGTVDSVALLQPGSFGGVINYEGKFEILSLTGSSTISEVGGVRRRTGGFSVSLAGPQGQIIGGGVAGPLVAASQIQTVVGSFIPNAYKYYKQKQQAEEHGNIHRVGEHPADGNTADDSRKALS